LIVDIWHSGTNVYIVIFAAVMLQATGLCVFAVFMAVASVVGNCIFVVAYINGLVVIYTVKVFLIPERSYA